MRLKSGTLDAYGTTHVGRVRTVNEDQFLIASLMKVVEIEQTSLHGADLGHLTSPGRAALLIVADGVGGQQAGEKASETALETVAQYATQAMQYYTVDEAAEERFVEELRMAVMRTHEAVVLEAEEYPERQGMATTLTVVKVINRRGYVIQVGDSRCYLLRNGELSQITRDQTIAQDLVDQGVMSDATAEHSPFSHILSSAIGGTAAPEVYTLNLETDDMLLLCTDGLTKHVTNVQIRDELTSDRSPDQMGDRLLQMALDDGGSDNVTVIIARVLADTEPE